MSEPRFQLASDFSPDQFLQDYWQQKPLLIRNLFSNFSDPVSAEELAGMACEPDLESRLVRGTWPGELRLFQGPFTEADFTSLPHADWTLLVQALDQWLPEIAALRQCFTFIPNWRLDDVMVSYATAGGTVGPHWDNYDVFLIQGSGSRRWQVGKRCTAATASDTSTGLRLLREFVPELDVELGPGDALYLPPRFSHWGMASKPGLCYSIGFRAPSQADMLEGFSDALIARADPDKRYEDPLPTLPRHPGELRPDHLDQAYRELTGLLTHRPAFDRWFACHVTQPRYPEQIFPPDVALDADTLAAAQSRGQTLLRHPGSRFAFMTSERAGVLCFADGACIELPEAELQAIKKLCDLSIENIFDFYEEFETDAGRSLVLHLVNQGSLVVDQG